MSANRMTAKQQRRRAQMTPEALRRGAAKCLGLAQFYEAAGDPAMAMQLEIEASRLTIAAHDRAAAAREHDRRSCATTIIRERRYGYSYSVTAN